MTLQRLIDYVVKRFENEENASEVVLTNVRALYCRAISTDDGQFRVCAAVLRPGETYNGPYAHAFLEKRDEVLLDLSDLRPRTILHLVCKFICNLT